ncbi:MAG: DUF1893 domain-containing protein [Olsenella sp.]|nr:DUF1893 domain-containing protein [Olsenella sp.]
MAARQGGAAARAAAGPADDLARARELLDADGRTVAAVRGGDVLASEERGVRPLLGWVSAGTSLEGFSVADKVVGKAPALLYCLLRPRAVFAPVMSSAARTVLEAHGIGAACEVEVDRILNASKTGQCPIDASVTDVSDPEEGLAAIRARLRELAAARAAAGGTPASGTASAGGAA